MMHGGNTADDGRDDLDPGTALARAERLGEQVRHRSTRWYTRFLLGLGAATLVTVSSMAVHTGPWREEGLALLCVALLVAVVVYAARRPVVRHGLSRRNGAVLGVWVALVAVAVNLVPSWLADRPAWYWPVAAAVASLPCFIGAYLERRVVTHA